MGWGSVLRDEGLRDEHIISFSFYTAGFLDLKGKSGLPFPSIFFFKLLSLAYSPGILRWSPIQVLALVDLA